MDFHRVRDLWDSVFPVAGVLRFRVLRQVAPKVYGRAGLVSDDVWFGVLR